MLEFQSEYNTVSCLVQSELRCPVQVTVLVNVYNNGCMGWEPVVEPWPVAASLDSRGLGAGAGGPITAQHRMTVTAHKPLELTASLPTADAAAVCQTIFRGGLPVSSDVPVLTPCCPGPGR